MIRTVNVVTAVLVLLLIAAILFPKVALTQQQQQPDPPSFSLNFVKQPWDATAGCPADYTVEVMSQGGFHGAVNLTVVKPPSKVKAVFFPSQVNVPLNSKNSSFLAIMVLPDTPLGSTNLTVRAVSAKGNISATQTLTFKVGPPCGKQPSISITFTTTIFTANTTTQTTTTTTQTVATSTVTNTKTVADSTTTILKTVNTTTTFTTTAVKEPPNTLPPPANSTAIIRSRMLLNGSIFATFSIDKPSYKPGELIHIKGTLTNLASNNITLQLTFPNVSVRNSTGTVWAHPEFSIIPYLGPPWESTITLRPGETAVINELTADWNMTGIHILTIRYPVESSARAVYDKNSVPEGNYTAIWYMDVVTLPNYERRDFVKEAVNFTITKQAE